MNRTVIIETVTGIFVLYTIENNLYLLVVSPIIAEPEPKRVENDSWWAGLYEDCCLLGDDPKTQGDIKRGFGEEAKLSVVPNIVGIVINAILD